MARIRFSPFEVSGSSVVPVCRPFNDHSVSPWRIMKTRGVDIVYIFSGTVSIEENIPDKSVDIYPSGCRWRGTRISYGEIGLCLSNNAKLSIYLQINWSSIVGQVNRNILRKQRGL